jgi:hypothetical protein
MLGRHIRLAGIGLIETALSTKLANDVTGIFNPSLGTLKATKTKELGGAPKQTASAQVPMVVAATPT